MEVNPRTWNEAVAIVNGGSKAMTKYERTLLLGLAEEIVLQLRARLAEIEELHPRESALSIATFQERMWRIQELLTTVKKEGDHPG